MTGPIHIQEKYERAGWPSLKRPDLKPPEGWSLDLVLGVDRIRNHRLSPDGQWIAFIWDRANLSDVYVMPVTGGWPKRITMDREAAAYWDDENPEWSPDGRFLAYTNRGHVHVVSPESGLARKTSDFTTEASVAHWMPDSRGLLAYVDRAGEAVQLLATDRDGSWPRPVVALSGDVRDARPSPDGSSVVVVFRPADDPNRWDLRIADLNTRSVRLLSGAPKQKDWMPRWSPDGRTIAFISQRGGWDQVWLLGADGQGLRQLTSAPNDVTDLAWSPDGKRLACTLNREGAFDLCLLDTADGQLTDLVRGEGLFSRPAWSPDGSFLTAEYESPLAPPDIYRIELPSGQMRQLTFSKPPALASKPLVRPELITYKSFDDRQIHGLLFKPPRPNGAAIVYPHGGPSGQYLHEWDALAQYFVAKGYTYLAPNYRGGTGSGVEFEHANYGDWGGADMQDVLHAARFLHTLSWIDRDRIAIFGGSYGGYMTALCLSRDPDYLFACGVSKYGDAHIENSWALCKRDLRVYTEMMLGHPGRNREAYIKGSPILQVDNIRRPVLILHGLADDVVPPEASEMWVEALKRAGKSFEYKTYADEPHGFLQRANLLDAYRRIERFLDWHLMPPKLDGGSQPTNEKA